MSIPPRAAARPSEPGRSRPRPAAAVLLAGVLAALLAGVLAALLAACGTTDPRSPTAAASGAPASGAGVASWTPAPTASPTATPLPTPHYTNRPDSDLAALIPDEVAGIAVEVPPTDEFAITPGDFGEAFGELGLRFRALQVAYVIQPRLSLFVARADGPPVATEDLEPHLETAGQYVGIAGLVREPWELQTIDGRLAWVRPEDDATALGTMIYTWAAEEYVFLMIGVDDRLNRAMFSALPGEPAPTPEPAPTRSPRPAASGSPATPEGETPHPS